MEPSEAVLARTLLPIAKRVSGTIRRIHGEHAAAHAPLTVQTALLESALSETLHRLRGGDVNDVWWRRVLNAMLLDYVAPEFFVKPSIQEWLNIPEVGDAFLTLARTQITGLSEINESSLRKLVSERYSEQTGDHERSARLPIDVVVATLVGGYIASIPPDQRALAGMVQTIGQSLTDLSVKLDGGLSADPLVSATLGSVAESELSSILEKRIFDYPTAVSRIHALWLRVNEGDLTLVPLQVKDRVCYWATRLHAANKETVEEAVRIRETLSGPEEGGNPLLLDALISAAEGEKERALQLLREESDADAKSVLLGILVRISDSEHALKYCLDVNPIDFPTHFTDSGWCVWTLCLARNKKWEEASSGLLGFSIESEREPMLAMIEGIVNAALLLPQEQRHLALIGPPTYKAIRPQLGEKARAHHERASQCFLYVEKAAPVDSGAIRKDLLIWKTWLGLMDPDRTKSTHARERLRQELEDSDIQIELVPIAWAFDIPFDTAALRDYFVRRERLGGLADDDLLAECLVSQSTMSPRKFARYMEMRMTTLDRILQRSQTVPLLFAALLEDGQIERARALVDQYRGDLDDGSIAFMETALDEASGVDPRKRLEDIFAASNSLVDLVNLIRYLKTVEDRSSLEPLVRELFARAPTLENAFEVVGLLGSQPTDHSSVVEFLEEHQEFVEADQDMQSGLAWSYFYIGRLQEADGLNGALLLNRNEPIDLSLDVQIAIATGDWERLAAIVDREWSHRVEHDSATLLLLAHISSQSGQSAERPLELARLATSKSPEDPQTLISAYGIHVELGQEDQADTNWIPKALEHSSEDGPLWQTDLADLVNNVLPSMREQTNAIEEKLQKGVLPLTIAARFLNMPLSRLLLGDSRASSPDGRQRRLIPIISGGHQPVEMSDEWTVGLDLTSIMVLERTGLLEKVFDTMSHVKLAHDVMSCLFSERTTVRFHQPARVESARRLRRLIDAGRITQMESVNHPSHDLASEVGGEIAMMVETCIKKGGVVVCETPIHKANSLRVEVADTSEFDHVLLSPADLCAIARRKGSIDSAQYKHAEAYMVAQRQERRRETIQRQLEGPIYLSSLAMTYLQASRVLELIANSGFDLRVHSNVLDETHAFIEAGETGDHLAANIENVRDTLRGAMESGKATLLPCPSDRTAMDLGRVSGVTSIEALLYGCGECDAVCIDDRYINSHSTIESPDGKSVPVLCVLDLLCALLGSSAINEEEFWSARHTLRAAGLAFIPLEVDELLTHLRRSEVEDGVLLENAELKVIRQTFNRFDTLELFSVEEAQVLSEKMALVCVATLQQIWIDDSIPVDFAIQLSDWVWRNLPVMTFLVPKIPPSLDSPTSLEEIFSSRLRMLMLNPRTRLKNRRDAYRQWLQRTVIEPLNPANPELVVRAALDVREWIDQLDENRELHGKLFLECLPDHIQQSVLQEHPNFGLDCGFEWMHVIELEDSLKVKDTELFEAARLVLAGNDSVDISDLAGIAIEVLRPDGSESVGVKWIGTGDEVHALTIQELSLLSESVESRQGAFSELIKHLGPTASHTLSLSESIGSRGLTNDEVSGVFAERSKGLMGVHSRIRQQIMSGWRANLDDFIPQSLDYWERFCGPTPVNEKPESYFSDQLIPYRRSLLELDLAKGLDICCLGALRDDMCPGAWLDDFDSDTVLKALNLIGTDGGPITLLGVLDVALYRVDDERFRQIAEQAITRLLDENLGYPDDRNAYRFFEALTDLLTNRLCLLRGSSSSPGYWRRMCAWMQAGLMFRMSLDCQVSPEIEDLERWCRDNLLPVGAIRTLLDCRIEPLVMGHYSKLGDLRHEVISRLNQIKERHQKAGREVPFGDEIEVRSAIVDSNLLEISSRLPSPLSLHLRPIDPLPKELEENLEETWGHLNDATKLASLARVSQFFVFTGSVS